MAQAIYEWGVIVGPTLGPAFGRIFSDNYSWPYIFYINIPLGIILYYLAISFVKPNGEKLKANQVDGGELFFCHLSSDLCNSF